MRTTSIKGKAAKSLREVPNEAFRLMSASYPAFVTEGRGAALREEVPVFMFHSVHLHSFRQQMEFLKINGYRTLTTDEFMAFLSGQERLQQPSVLLTFDDGDRSWYHVAYPLLKEYGFQATGFVVPCYLQEEAGRSAASRWLSWAEVIEMEQSGVFDIQSHTFSHARIFVAPQLIDFFHPDFSVNGLGLDVPWIDEGGKETNNLAWGTPIYRYGLRLQEKPRYLDNAALREVCVAYVAAHGGREFFRNPRWRKELQNVFNQNQRDEASGYESHAVQRQRMIEDLRKARETLETRLDKPIHHLCYPEGVGSELSVSLSQETGYHSNFWVVRRDRRTNRRGDSPFHIPRLKDDYIVRLPGQGRESLWKIFGKKLERRVRTTDLY